MTNKPENHLDKCELSFTDLMDCSKEELIQILGKQFNIIEKMKMKMKEVANECENEVDPGTINYDMWQQRSKSMRQAIDILQKKEQQTVDEWVEENLIAKDDVFNRPNPFAGLSDNKGIAVEHSWKVSKKDDK